MDATMAKPADLAAALAGKVALSAPEAARALGLAEGTVRLLIRRGEIPAKRVGGRWIVPVRGLHEWAGDLSEVESPWKGAPWLKRA